jgi:hypothetical protein
LKEVRRRMQATSGFKDRRKVSLYNTKISALMAQLNEGPYFPPFYRLFLVLF